MNRYYNRLRILTEEYETLISRENKRIRSNNGIFERYKYPILTAAHTPLEWRYDFNPETNPFLMERFGINAVFNAGAIKYNGKYLIMARVEGYDRKSFFAIAESPNGIDNFRFWEYPIQLPDLYPEETNVYDMRLTQHEDGWIYGIFCSESKDPDAAAGDLTSAVAVAGIIRTKDLRNWERLPNLISKSQQRNVVLHPEFVKGKYALYTRPQDGFIEAGTGGGICWALVDDITHAIVKEETVVEQRYYHTIKEVKNGEADKDDNVLINAPHPEYEIVSDRWEHSYTREKAAYPIESVRENKFWINVARVDNTLGDRKLLPTRYGTFE